MVDAGTGMGAGGKHLPGQHQIEKFGNGGFRFGGMSHQGSLLILPSGMRALSTPSVDQLDGSMLQGLLSERAGFDFVIIGTGQRMVRLPQQLSKWFGDHAIPVDAMSTAAAVRTYNVVASEGRPVAALLISVDEPSV